MSWLARRRLRRAAAEYQRSKELRDLIREVLVAHDRQRDAEKLRSQLRREAS